MSVDLYVGGVEHANLHLLYARFWHKVLFDLGLVSHNEPFKKVLHQGMILGSNNEKMSKSRGNVVNPDAVIEEWGADSLRLFEMFMGPFEQVKPWQSKGIVGVHRFLKRVWRLFIEDNGETSSKLSLSEASKEENSEIAKLIKKVSHDTEQMQFNTAIAAMMEFVNYIYKEQEQTLTRRNAERFLQVLAPYAPHMVEELWEALGHQGSISLQAWPNFDAADIIDDLMVIAVMVNGKTRDTLEIPKDTSREQATQLAKGLEAVRKHLENQKIKKEIFVPGKIINFVLAK